jgi:hypothetical protein
MATQIPINTFKLVPKDLNGGENIIYTSPVNISAIVLSLHITNYSPTDQRVSVRLVSGSVTASILVEALVPAKETLNPFSGRVVLETSNSLVVSASNSSVMQAALSILENANT